MDGEYAVLLALLHQIRGRRPGGRAFHEPGGLGPSGLGKGILIQSPGLFLHLKALPDGRLQARGIKINIGDGGKKAFHHEGIHLLIPCPRFPCLVGKHRKALQAVQQVVLQRGNLRLLSAYARYLATYTFCRLLTLMTEHISSPFEGNLIQFPNWKPMVMISQILFVMPE